MLVRFSAAPKTLTLPSQTASFSGKRGDFAPYKRYQSCAQKMLLCEVRMKNAFGSEYPGKLVMRLFGQEPLEKRWN